MRSHAINHVCFYCADEQLFNALGPRVILFGSHARPEVSQQQVDSLFNKLHAQPSAPASAASGASPGGSKQQRGKGSPNKPLAKPPGAKLVMLQPSRGEYSRNGCVVVATLAPHDARSAQDVAQALQGIVASAGPVSQFNQAAGLDIFSPASLVHVVLTCKDDAANAAIATGLESSAGPDTQQQQSQQVSSVPRGARDKLTDAARKGLQALSKAGVQQQVLQLCQSITQQEDGTFVMTMLFGCPASKGAVAAAAKTVQALQRAFAGHASMPGVVCSVTAKYDGSSDQAQAQDAFSPPAKQGSLPPPESPAAAYGGVLTPPSAPLPPLPTGSPASTTTSSPPPLQQQWHSGGGNKLPPMGTQAYSSQQPSPGLSGEVNGEGVVAVGSTSQPATAALVRATGGEEEEEEDGGEDEEGPAGAAAAAGSDDDQQAGGGARLQQDQQQNQNGGKKKKKKKKKKKAKGNQVVPL